MFSFSLVYCDRTRIYFCDNEIEYNKWIHCIQKVIGYEDLNSTYEINKGKLGQGEFGVVRECLHKNTNRYAAIKIISKKIIKQHHLQMVRIEIEILKIAQHPNLIKLYDVLENEDYIYISKLIKLKLITH